MRPSISLLVAALVGTALAAPAFESAEPYLDSLILAEMATNHIPGLAACVVRGSELAWHGEYGFARLEDSVPVVDSTVFDLASVSKTATAAALMQLSERGLFELDDDINASLPFSVRHASYPSTPITFRMLLTHTSGIVDYWPTFQRLQRQGDPDVPLRRFVEGYLVPGGEFFDSTNNFGPGPPGTEYRYSNLAIALAGYLVEANADSFHCYTRDSLFHPLGMNRTVWYFRDIDTNGMAMPYYYSDLGHVRYGHQSLPDVPAGTLKSSALQLVRFTAAVMNYGCWQGVRILDSATAALMTTVQHPSGVGLVFRQTYIGPRETWGHAGMWNGISTRIAFCRADRTAVVVLCNLGAVSGTIEGIFLPALFGWASSVRENGPGSDASPRPGSANDRTPGSEPLVLFDITGRRVARLQFDAGSPARIRPGVYFARSASGSTRKIVARR